MKIDIKVVAITAVLIGVFGFFLGYRFYAIKPASEVEQVAERRKTDSLSLRTRALQAFSDSIQSIAHRDTLVKRAEVKYKVITRTQVIYKIDSVARSFGSATLDTASFHKKVAVVMGVLEVENEKLRSLNVLLNVNAMELTLHNNTLQARLIAERNINATLRRRVKRTVPLALIGGGAGLVIGYLLGK